MTNYEPQDTSKSADPGSADTELKKYAEQVNIAEKIDEEKLLKIGNDCRAGFELDLDSRKQWMADTREWLKLAQQLRETKDYPWRRASNIKYPLISVAALQFAARSYPSLIPGDGQIVKTRVIGKDPDGQKAEKAQRVGKYMSWQFMYDMPRWEEDMDRMLIMLPVCGMLFKKTYYDTVTEKPCSELVYPENFVADYWTNTLEDAERYSEIMYMSERRVKERQANEYFCDITLPKPTLPLDLGKTEASHSAQADDTVPYCIIQQATWLDLDKDGIKEPYYVVFHRESGKVLRIFARFDTDDIHTNAKGDVTYIDAQCHYTKFGFIPNPDGSFYDLGFGHLLGPINESVNTIINQLVDSGTLANLQAGFIGKGFRVKMGDVPLAPGEWRVVNAVGDDLRKQVLPLPAKEPSKTLYELLGMLVTSGKELASVAEIFVGKMPGQNTPATTTMATIEQGMKVFTAIYKRIYRAMEKEFKKVFELNNRYLDKDTYTTVLDEPIGPDDFDSKSYDICPASDPAASSQSERLMKAQALLELLPTGILDPTEVVMRVLEAQDQPNWQKLIPGMAETGKPAPQQQKPDPKAQEMQMKMQAEAQKSQLQQQTAQQKMAMDAQAGKIKLGLEQQKAQLELQSKQAQAQTDAQIAHHKQEIFMQQSAQQMQVDNAQHSQTMQQDKASHDMKMQQTKEMAKSQQTAKGTSGSSGKTTKSRK